MADPVAALDLTPLAPERPYLITNFALTLDGHATIAGRSGPIGSGDRHRDAGRPEDARRGGDDRRRDDARRALRARDRRPGKREAREREGLPAGPLGGDRLRTARPALGRAAVHRGRRTVPDLHLLGGRRPARHRDRGRGAAPGEAGSTCRRCSRTCAASGVRACSARAGRVCTPSCSTPGSSTSSSSPMRRSSPVAHAGGRSSVDHGLSARSSSPGCRRGSGESSAATACRAAGRVGAARAGIRPFVAPGRQMIGLELGDQPRGRSPLPAARSAGR